MLMLSIFNENNSLNLNAFNILCLLAVNSIILHYRNILLFANQLFSDKKIATNPQYTAINLSQS